MTERVSLGSLALFALSLTWVVTVVSSPALAQPTLLEESFEAPAGWSWGLPTEVVSTGGSPGAFLESSGILDSALPKLSTAPGVDSNFVGDFRATGVRAVGVSLRIDAVATPQGRPLAVELVNDAGTPSNVDDDCSVYLVGLQNIPFPGDGWVDYTFRIPSNSTSLPNGWLPLSAFGNRCAGLSDDEAWELVIQDVSQLKFSYGDPSFFFIFQQWQGLALDNPVVALGASP